MHEYSLNWVYVDGLPGSAKSRRDVKMSLTSTNVPSVIEKEKLQAVSLGGQIQRLTITQPDDWHLHLRDGDGLASIAPLR